MSNINDQIEKTNEKIKQLENRKKELLSKQREEERKKRTRRLIERGAILESAIRNAEDFSNEQIQSLLIEIFSSESVRAKVEYLRRSTEREG